MFVTTRLFREFRQEFNYDRVINWFPGHMAKGLRLIQQRMNETDILIEVRDSRIPLSSMNPKFERLISQSKERIVVFNKMDLIQSESIQKIRHGFKHHTNLPILFTDANQDKNVKKIIEMARAKIEGNPLKYPFINIMVVGMPNVGKSSLINSLRRVGTGKGKAMPTGAQPGITRSVGSTVKVWQDPPIYLVDTPGVMIPHIPNPEQSLKVAVTGGVRDHLADCQVMSDYILYQLNKSGLFDYVELFKLVEPTENIEELLTAVAKRTGLLHKGGIPNLEGAAAYWLKRYRMGALGKQILDDITLDGFAKHFEILQDLNQLEKDTKNLTASEVMNNPLLSKQQVKKIVKNKRLEKIKAKRIKMGPRKF